MEGGGFFIEDEDPEEPPATPFTRHTSSAARAAPCPEEELYDEEAAAAMDELEHGSGVQQGVRDQLAHGGEDEEFDLAAAAAMDELERRGAAAPLPRAPTHDTRPQQREGMCECCGDAPPNQRFLEAFGVLACFDCQRAHKGHGGRYQVISKTKAKEEYLLTDRQLNKVYGGLGCITMPNPHDSRFGDMKLYLRVQAEELAIQAWGSEEGLFEEKERRSEERCRKAHDKAAAKRGMAAGQTSGGRRGGKRARGLEIATADGAGPGAAATAKALLKLAPARHEHCFLPDETYNEATDTWTKRCACGFTLDYERM